MKVLRGKLLKSGQVTELTAELEDQPLAWCMWNNVPWVAPHKDLKVFEGIDWQSSSPLAYFRAWYGTPMVEAEEMPDEGIYNADIAVPNVTVDQICLGLLSKKRRVFFVHTDQMEVLGELMEIAEKAGKSLEIETHEKRWVVYPHYVQDWLTRYVGTNVYVHLGFRPGLATRTDYDTIDAVEIRFWKGGGRIERLDSAEGSCIVTSDTETELRVIGKQGWQPFPAVSRITEEELPKFLFAYPVKQDVAEILIETPLADMDEVFVPRTHMKERLTMGQLQTFIERRLGIKTKNGQDVIRILGEYAEAHDAELVKSLGAPMMVLSGESGESAKTWVSAPRVETLVPKPCDLSEVRSTLHDIIEDGNDVTSDLLLNLLSRACVVMHLRNTTVFDPTYRTQMFTYSGLLEALLKAESNSKSGYVTPFLMIGALDRKKRSFTERKTVTGGVASSPLIGGAADDW